MKRFFVISLTLLLASVALVAAIERDPGYMLISYSTHTIETSIWIGLGGLVLLFALIYGFFSVIRRLLNRSTAISLWLSGRGHRRSQKQTALGLINFIEGNWKSSRRILAKSADKSETPLLNYLFAARASHELNDDLQTKEFLKKAEQSTSSSSIAVRLSQAEMQLTSGQYEQCLATLTRLRNNAGKYPYILRLLKDVYEGLHDAKALVKLLPELKKYNIVAADQFGEYELSAYIARIDEIVKFGDNVVFSLAAFWKTIPKFVAVSDAAVLSYASHLHVLGEDPLAEKIIRKQLKKSWNRDLVTLYGRISVENVDKQLLHAEHWLKERNNDAALFLCLGRLAMRNSQWEKAREYFENNLKMENNAEVYAELGRLLSHLGELQKSNDYFQRGLTLSSNSLPLLPLPKETASP